MTTMTNMHDVTDVRVHRYDDVAFAVVKFVDEHDNIVNVFTNDLAGLLAQIAAAAAEPQETP